MSILDEVPRQEKVKLVNPTKDILWDGRGIWCVIEKGPMKGKSPEGKEITWALVSSQVGSEFRYFYPDILPLPNQFPELFRLEAPSHHWYQLNDDQYAGAYILLSGFDGSEDTPLFNLHKILLKSIESMQEQIFVMEPEIFRLREENFNLTIRAYDEIKKLNLAHRELIDQPIYQPRGDMGGGSNI